MKISNYNAEYKCYTIEFRYDSKPELYTKLFYLEEKSYRIMGGSNDLYLNLKEMDCFVKSLLKLPLFRLRYLTKPHTIRIYAGGGHIYDYDPNIKEFWDIINVYSLKER